MVGFSPPAPVYLLAFGAGLPGARGGTSNGLRHLNLCSLSGLLWARGDWWRRECAREMMCVKRFKNFPDCYPMGPQETTGLEPAEGGKTPGLFINGCISPNPRPEQTGGGSLCRSSSQLPYPPMTLLCFSCFPPMAAPAPTPAGSSCAPGHPLPSPPPLPSPHPSDGSVRVGYPMSKDPYQLLGEGVFFPPEGQDFF